MGTRVKCRPGDLALTVAAKNAENVGLLVEVLAVATGEPFKLTGCGFVWQVRCPGGHRGLLYTYKDGRCVALNEGPVPDACLQPLRGLPARQIPAGLVEGLMGDGLMVTVCPSQQSVA